MGTGVHIASLDRIGERVIDHLQQGHHTALVGSPGCGMTTFVNDLMAKAGDRGFTITHFDARSRPITELARELAARRLANAGRTVIVLDHVCRLPRDDYRRLLKLATDHAAGTGDLCLWCGNLDVRAADRQLGMKLCSVPSAHVTFPVVTRDELVQAYRVLAGERGAAHVSFPILTRDELAAAYQCIASERSCRWGDAVIYLMLDLCGTDLSLVKSATDYLHGDWSDRLYDESIWDRISEWLKEDDAVDAYRTRLNALPANCETILALVRFGGKPQCLRAELIEEADDGLRQLCLDGFIIPNLLPGFYQLRNLVVRFLLDESIQPELLFRRATNERAAALLQDTETMLRQVLASVFGRIGVDAAREKLEGMQQPGEVIDKELNRALLDWAKQNCTVEAVKSLNDLLLEHRTRFKTSNSVWETVTQMMQQDNVGGNGLPHIQCIDYLTFDQLGRLVLGLMEAVFPRLTDDVARKRIRENWQEGVAKVRRLRNQVAHLRNVGFQDMEDLARTLERMRRDVIDFGGWKDSRPAEEPAAIPATANQE